MTCPPLHFITSRCEAIKLEGFFFLTEKNQWETHWFVFSLLLTAQSLAVFIHACLFVLHAEHRTCCFCRDANRDSDLRVGGSSNQDMLEPQTSSSGTWLFCKKFSAWEPPQMAQNLSAHAISRKWTENCHYLGKTGAITENSPLKLLHPMLSVHFR